MIKTHGESGGIPYIEFRGSTENPEIVYLHANAFPPECYSPLLEKLSEKFTVVCPLFRPLWNPPVGINDIKDWTPLLQNTVQFLESKYPKNDVFVLGHSLGGNIGFRLCLEYPELVKSAILLDPILFPKNMIFFWQFIQWSKLGFQIHPMIKASKNQRLNYPSFNEMYDRYRTKKIFRRISDSNLKELIKGLTREKSDGGVELCFPKDWELRIYQAGMVADIEIWNRINNLNRDIYILHAEYTHAPTEKVMNKVSLASPLITTEILNGFTHFFPFEIPEKVEEGVIEMFKNH